MVAAADIVTLLLIGLLYKMGHLRAAGTPTPQAPHSEVADGIRT